MKNIRTQNIILTGGSRGLGAKLAEVFWNAGANLILVARHSQDLEKRVKNLPPRATQQVHICEADLSDTQAADQIIHFAREKFERLDVLVNNAAIQGPIGPSWENDTDAWLQTIQVNLLSPVQLCKLAVKWMLRQHSGKIINISGGGAASPRANFSAYATAKAGLVRFCETLAEETLLHNIDVNCVAPGLMNSSLTQEVLKAGEELAGPREVDIAQKAHQNSEVTIKHAGELVLFLASSRSDGITGKLISAVWDPWEKLPEHLENLKKSDIFTLRRILPKDRGQTWGDL